jgi:disulfide oxidoreductase YuzD
MNKITNCLIALALLSSCAHVKTAKEIEEGYKLDYQSYSCPQLHQKYTDIKARNAQEKKSRQAMNAVNTVVGVMGMIGGNGNMKYNSQTEAEKNSEIEIKAIEKLAIDKQCEGISFN